MGNIINNETLRHISPAAARVVDQVSNTVKKRWDKAQSEEAERNRLVKYTPELLPKLNYSPQEFYALVEQNMAAREVLGLEAQYLMMSQGGPATTQRLYLQLRRERMFIEICAMQFGTGFFVSERVFERKLRGPAWRILAGLFIFAGISAFVWTAVGWIYGVLTFTGLIALVLSVMRLAARNAADMLDRTLSDLYIIGPIYEFIFHPNTYFREDTNRAYQDAVHDALQEAKDQIKTNRGSRGLSGLTGAPAVEDLHRL